MQGIIEGGHKQGQQHKSIPIKDIITKVDPLSPSATGHFYFQSDDVTCMQNLL